MLLVFVLLIITLLHIQFFVRNILFGLDEATFFTFTIRYLFDEDLARASLYFALTCAGAFALCYLVTHRLGKIGVRRWVPPPSGIDYALPMWPLVASGLLQIVAASIIIVQSNFVYQLIAEQLEQAGFVLELRVVFLLLLSHLLLNVRIGEVMKSPRFKWARITFYIYLVTALLMQARSRIFEVAAIIAFTQLMWDGDRLRVKYFFLMGFALIAPNLIVLGRLGWPQDFASLIDGVFSFEYTILFNNLLSAAIDAGQSVGEPYTFSSSMGLVLPSPIRSLFDVTVVKSDYYTELAEAANIRNGGFALLAELFTNFGWNAIWVFGGIGGLIGYLNARALRVGRASLMTCVAPLFYTAFILAFRNDLGVFFKYVIQLIFIAWTMNLMTKITMMPKRKHDMK
jgi:hypothetical protein